MLDVDLLVDLMIWLESYISPVVATTSIILSSNKIQNGVILVPAYPGCPGNWPLNKCLPAITIMYQFSTEPLTNFFENYVKFAVPVIECGHCMSEPSVCFCVLGDTRFGSMSPDRSFKSSIYCFLWSPRRLVPVIGPSIISFASELCREVWQKYSVC